MNSVYTSDALLAIQAVFTYAYTFMTSINVPGTSISFFQLFGTLLLATVFVTLFRRFLGMDFDINVSQPTRDRLKSSRSNRIRNKNSRLEHHN